MLPSGKDLAALGKAVKPTAVMATPHRIAVSISRRSISCMVFYSTEFEAKHDAYEDCIVRVNFASAHLCSLQHQPVFTGFVPPRRAEQTRKALVAGTYTYFCCAWPCSLIVARSHLCLQHLDVAMANKIVSRLAEQNFR